MKSARRCQEITSAHFELIARRGRRLGLRGADLDDAIQEAAIAVLSFEFDERRSQGATRNTVLTAVIDRCLKGVLRRESRYRRRVERFVELAASDLTADGQANEPQYCECLELPLDVREALATLDERDQQICRSLSEGQSWQEIARQLRCDWHTLRRRVDRIRCVWERLGLGDWVTTTAKGAS